MSSGIPLCLPISASKGSGLGASTDVASMYDERASDWVQASWFELVRD